MDSDRKTGPLPAHPQVKDAIDADFIDASADVDCMDELVSIAERSAYLIDDVMNETESEEERNAAAEAQAMR